MRRKNTTTYQLKSYIAQGLLILMRNRAFSQISIEEIAQKAGVNRSTYYRHFKSKEDIIRFYFYTILDEYKTVYDKTLTFNNHLQRLLTHYLKYKKELLLIYKNGLSHVIIDVLNEYFLTMQKNNILSFEEQYRIYWNTGGIYNTLLLWFTNDMKESPGKMSEMYNTIILNSNDREFLMKPFL